MTVRAFPSVRRVLGGSKLFKAIKRAFKSTINSMGFDIVLIKNIEYELKRREEGRASAKQQEIRRLRAEQKQSLPKPSVGSFTRVDRDHLEREANKLLRPASTVLDIGCAFNPQKYIAARTHICCEPCEEYMDRLLVETSSDSKYVYLKSELARVCELFPHASVDTVFLLDVIEHADKRVGASALENLKKIVRSQIVVFTPLGYMEQEPKDEGVDPWGMGAVEWQKHRSGWVPEDFPTADGWSIVMCENFFQEDAYGRKLPEPIGAFWAVWFAS